MKSGAKCDDLTPRDWDVAMLGRPVDERGLAADAFVRSHARTTMAIEYDPDTFGLDFAGNRSETDELVERLEPYAKSRVILESTTLGFVEIFLLCRAFIRLKARTVAILYVEPNGYNRPRRREVLYRRDFELSSEVAGYRAVPGAALMLTDRKPQHGVFFLGFEERRLDVALEDFQTIRPSDCSVVFGVPAYQAGWELDAFANNVRVIESKRISGGVHFCGAENPAAALDILNNIRNGVPHGTRMFVAPIGTKPSGIGAALFAAANEDVGILYDHPKKMRGRTEEVSRWHLFDVEF